MFFDDDIRKNFFDVIFNANRSLVEKELDELLEKLAVMSQILEKSDIDENKIFTYATTNSENIEKLVNDIRIDVVGKILSNQE